MNTFTRPTIGWTVFAVVFICRFLFSQSYVDSITINQLTDGSGLVLACFKVYSSESTVAVAMQSSGPGFPDWSAPVITILDTLSEFSDAPNYGWRVSASPTGRTHCFLWNFSNDIGNVENCSFRARGAVYDSIRAYFSIVDSFPVADSTLPSARAFGLTYRHGKLWVLFHNEVTHECWIRPYTLPDFTSGDSIYIGLVAVGPSDMAFAGKRLFWIEDTRVLLKEFNFETGTSTVVRGDWWGLPGTSNHLAGAAFDGQHLWVCFCEGTFIALDTSDFSLVDTMFFPYFGSSVPATCADGLAWGLGLLWCYSNDNVVYGIDVKSKSIIYTIPTGSVVVMTGAEGAAWDGTNLWVVDYGRGFVYKLSLFSQIRFTLSSFFCLDNTPPTLSWLNPSCPDFSDTFFAGETTLLVWSSADSHLAGGITTIFYGEDTIFSSSATETTYQWRSFPWVGWSGRFVLQVTDGFGNTSMLTSCRFYITEGSRVDNLIFTHVAPSIEVFPNPFNSACVIKINYSNNTIKTPALVRIFDALGRCVWQSVFLSDRTYEIWSPGKDLKSGIYFIRAKIGGREITRSLIYSK